MSKIPKTDNFIVDLREKTKRVSGDANFATDLPKAGKGRGNAFKYGNGFLLIIFIGVVLFFSLAMASEEIRKNTIGAKQVYAEGIDNTALLAADLDSFNMDFTIIGIVEDEESYTVTYSYVDLDAVSGVWQYVEREGGRRISKPFRRDLGLYLAGELSEEASARLRELRAELQKARETGETKIVEVTEYSGLLGKVLDISTNVFPGYEPVKKVAIETPLINERARTRAQQGATDSLADVYQDWVETHPQEVANLNNGTSTDDIINQDAVSAGESAPAETAADGNESETAAAEDTGSGEVAGEAVSDDVEPANGSPGPATDTAPCPTGNTGADE